MFTVPLPYSWNFSIDVILKIDWQPGTWLYMKARANESEKDKNFLHIPMTLPSN